MRKGPDGRPVTVEREAGFARRRGKAFFGFKAHLAVDRGSGLVRRAKLTPANVNETLVGDDLVIGDEAAVYADKGYDPTPSPAEDVSVLLIQATSPSSDVP